MQRRQYLGAATTTAAAGLAGCMDLGILGGNGPAAVVEQFYQALDDGDRGTANDLIHSESPQGEIGEQEMAQFESYDITVESTEVLDESDDTAEVEVELTLEADGESSTNTMTVELRTEGGDWKVYQ
ncbi:nuclear transport factor 2 family protein [Halostella salina]|uniref:DUF4878 domain-containing protein n=1 Tax=Halostella salina TaxID=1547897 RepID=UPI000EF85303|nr:DUF4878 domain-containing protein [Halostella salina]